MRDGYVGWAAELAERYRRAGHWQGRTLGELVRGEARDAAGRVALVGQTGRLTYGALDTAADRVAAGLHRLGIRPGDRVVVQLPNVPQFVVLALALFRLGAVPVLALPAHRRSEIQFLCSHAGAVAYVVPDTLQRFDYRVLAREIRASVPTLRHVIVMGDSREFVPFDAVDANPVALPPPRPGDVAFLLLSGSTAGRPRLIPRTHDDYMYQLRASAAAVAFDRSGVYLAMLPAAHNAALGCPGILGALLAGGRVVLASSPSPAEVFELIEREHATLTTLISPLLAVWLRTAELMNVRFPRLLLQVGGARLDPELGRQVGATLGCKLTHWFGMAEGLLAHTALDAPIETVVATQGRPLSADDELRIVDDEDRDVPPGSTGHLLARGPYTIRGYYDDPEADAAAFTPDGYLRTGDLARFDHAGNLVIAGRVKDVVNRGGEKVPVQEVEEFLRRHPRVREAAVVPVADPKLGERVGAVVVPAGEPPDLEDLRKFLLLEGLADYKLPERLAVVPSLPRTGQGRPDKAALRALVAEASPAGPVASVS